MELYREAQTTEKVHKEKDPAVEYLFRDGVPDMLTLSVV